MLCPWKTGLHCHHFPNCFTFNQKGSRVSQQSLTQYLTLNSGRHLPSIGFGLWKVERNVAADLVVAAAKAGYRHFDSASDYGNEVESGAGLQRVLQQKICTRDQLWVTSKLWNTYHRAKHVRAALTRTLYDLQLDYLDLYLIHFPVTLEFVPFETRYPAGWFHDPDAAHPVMKPDRVPVSETWGAMEDLVKEGLVKDIGVSNFGVSLIRDLLSYASITPSVLQVELHPYLTQTKLLRFCAESGIAVTGFSPLGAQSYFSLGMASSSESVLADPVVLKIAERCQRTLAQTVMRWALQRGTAIVPKTSRPDRMRENLSLFDFELTEQEMQAITALNRNRRFNDPGDFCEQAFNTFYPIYE